MGVGAGEGAGVGGVAHVCLSNTLSANMCPSAVICTFDGDESGGLPC